jgi:hypothetical protein
MTLLFGHKTIIKHRPCLQKLTNGCKWMLFYDNENINYAQNEYDEPLLVLKKKVLTGFYTSLPSGKKKSLTTLVLTILTLPNLTPYQSLTDFYFSFVTAFNGKLYVSPRFAYFLRSWRNTARHFSQGMCFWM